MLKEVPGPLGVLLWRALRDTTLWAAARQGGRRRLFAPTASRRMRRDAQAAPVPPELGEPLRVLASLRCPGGAPAGRVARACGRLARWAEAAGAPGTALAFAQAAALAEPESARSALRTAVLAERCGQEIRAETWLRRALTLARARRDRLTQAHACLHLGRVLARRGEAARAERMLQRALRLAKTRRGGDLT